MDGWTDGHIYGQTERSEIFFYEDGTNIVISYRWHKSHFYAGGTNVIF